MLGRNNAEVAKTDGDPRKNTMQNPIRKITRAENPALRSPDSCGEDHLPPSGGLPVLNESGCVLRFVFPVRIHHQNCVAHMFLVNVTQTNGDGSLMTDIAP